MMFDDNSEWYEEVEVYNNNNNVEKCLYGDKLKMWNCVG